MNHQKNGKTIQVPGYGQGVGYLIGAASTIIVLLILIESSRAVPPRIPFLKKPTIERIPADEARKSGLTLRNN